MADETFDFRTWIRAQHGAYETDFTNDDHFVLETPYATAQINFYAMDPDPEIVEFHIQNKADDETKFFLHFHATDRDHATGLFREMVESLMSLEHQQTTEVLLCCTAGMTTSFFAERLNQVAQSLGLDWSFSAVSVNEVYEQGADKAAILVAPQIGYQYDRIVEVMQNVPVLLIPTAIFASYDAAGCLEFVRDELRKRAQTPEERTAAHVSPCTPNTKRILAIAVNLNSKGAKIDYRLYDHGQVALTEKVIKRKLTVRDLTDIIDTQVCPCSGRMNADIVGIALPGVVHEGKLDLPRRATHDLSMDEDDFSLGTYLNERYSIPVALCNNANAAAMGWYGNQEDYQNIVFYSQPLGWAMGGQGIVINGKLVIGAHGIAGENKIIAQQFSFSRPLQFNPYNPTDTLELVGKILAMDMATIDPEVICIHCPLLPNMDEVSSELERYVPRSRMPKLVRIENYNEYILLGTMVHCLKQLKSNG